jgi:2-polyprenyl-3-methyl-5-hydroxy-6-metoxy-1,4-benzoquinol methylase
MPTIEENKAKWDGTYDWEQAGDEWSVVWGGTRMQWYGTLLPRIQAFLPAGTILEIAPGYGRWTQFLKDQCKRMIVVDLSEKCIDACRQRFRDCTHISYHVNDGKSLAMVPDHAVDFAFSFDSLVHVEEAVVSAYVSQLATKLTGDGVAFIHHSNLGAYPRYVQLQQTPKLLAMLRRLGLVERSFNWRGLTMSAAKMELLAEANGLQCISQEIFPWATKRALIDCISVLVRKDSIWSGENRILRNPSFMKEGRYLAALSRLYSDSPAKRQGETR